MAEIRKQLVEPHLASHPHPLLFVTGSGAHLYGFPSKDSDYDLRGAHVLPSRLLLGLEPPRETYEVMDRDGPVEMDIVTHDVRKYFKMLLSKNGYVLEQIFSPIVLQHSAEFAELRDLAGRVLTRFHHYHFERFAQSQWSAVAGSDHGSVKGLLYTYRPLLAGIHLMTERAVESNIIRLNERFRLSYIDDLVAQKVGGHEKQSLADTDMRFHLAEFERLRNLLSERSAASGLPDSPPDDVRASLEDLLLRLRRA